MVIYGGQKMIKFHDLSIPVRLAVIIAWLQGIVFGIMFLIGFLEVLLYGI